MHSTRSSFSGYDLLAGTHRSLILPTTFEFVEFQAFGRHRDCGTCTRCWRINGCTFLCFILPEYDDRNRFSISVYVGLETDEEISNPYSRIHSVLFTFSPSIVCYRISVPCFDGPVNILRPRILISYFHRSTLNRWRATHYLYSLYVATIPHIRKRSLRTCQMVDSILK